MELTAQTWDSVITNTQHVWVVKFYSAMCSSCQAFKPEWEQLTQMVDGLHWGELNIDRKENIPVAKSFGVLKEGIPNIKLFGIGDEPLPIMTGDVLNSWTLKEELEKSGALKDSSHFYLSSPKVMRSEL